MIEIIVRKIISLTVSVRMLPKSSEVIEKFIPLKSEIRISVKARPKVSKIAKILSEGDFLFCRIYSITKLVNKAKNNEIILEFINNNLPTIKPFKEICAVVSAINALRRNTRIKPTIGIIIPSITPAISEFVIKL